MSVNQQVNTKNQFTLLGYGYDASGDAVDDGLAAGCSGHGYSWNAEGKQSCANGTTYTYDGDEERVKKSNGTLYWGGGAGAALAESDLSGNLTEEYVFFNGQRIAMRNASTHMVSYFVLDHLGSTSVLADAAGNILNDSDYTPYGGEIPFTTGNPAQHYKFTGKERDTESGNDYFGARYYASSMGRFMSPDWSAKVEPIPYSKLDDPQTLNLYAYMVNNPTSGVDTDGHAPLSWGGFEDCSERGDCNGGGQTQAQQVYNGITRDVANGATVTVKSSQYTNVADAKGMNGAQLKLEAWVIGGDSAAYNWKQTVTESVKSADGHPPNKPFNDADPDTGLYWSADNQAAFMKLAAKDGAQAFFYDDPKDFGGVSFKWHADLSLVGIGKGGKQTALWKTKWGFTVDGKTGKTTLENDGKLPGVTQ